MIQASKEVPTSDYYSVSTWHNIMEEIFPLSNKKILEKNLQYSKHSPGKNRKNNEYLVKRR